ncbi:MAG: transposase [Candidatus Bipolaricaulota bacterium]|nr:transposase [Candidatus Bipolaricaulota bacterium]
MPRIERGLVNFGVYHVLNRGNARQRVFDDGADYSSFVALLKEAKDRYSVHIFAYCLMPNHFHLVMQPDHGEALSRFMQWLLTSHVRRYHQRRGTSGHVWQGRYKSFLIQRDAHLLIAIRYVERNPVRAGLVDSAADWRWSSHQSRIGKAHAEILDPCPMMLPVDWGEYVDQPLLESDLASLRRSVNRQAPYGSAQWQGEVSIEHGLQATLRPRGRPRKIRNESRKK